MSSRPGGLGLFWWVRARVWRAGFRALRREPLKLVVAAGVWSALLVGVYAIAYRGIRFVNETAGLGPFLLSRLWFLFLFVLILLLSVSQVVNGYSTLIRSPETRYWMTLPVDARTLTRAKWLESSLYSSWASVLLALPLCLAYFRVLQQPWWLVGGVVGLLLVPLTGIVTALATAVLLVWLRWFSRIVIRRELIPLVFVLAAAVLFWVLGERHRETQQDVWFLTLQALLPRMQIATSAWMPSSWAATATDAGINGRWAACGGYALLLWTTALLAWRLLDHLSAGLLWPVLRQHAQSFGASPASHREGEAPVRLAIRWWMRGPLAASLMKDAFLVIRDPMQWSQALVFFGLLGAYFGNIHQLAQWSVEPAWRVGVASLNLACTLLVFGSLCVRFVFPQMSLEGRSLWLLRIVPHGIRQLLVSKLCLYGTLGVLVTEGLLWLSVNRLGVPPPVRWWLALIGMIGSLTLVGLTVGFGAWWIDPTAQDAARVVSSSQGALVLVFVLGYIACVAAVLVLVWTGWAGQMVGRVVLASVGLVAVSVIVGLTPFVKGLARLERLESA